MNSWLFFALIAPLFWAFANAMDTAVRRHFVKSNLAASWLLAVTRVPVILTIFLWPNLTTHTASLASLFFMLLAGVLWILPFLWYYAAIEFEEPSRIILFMQISNLFVLGYAYILIAERLSLPQGIGFVLILLGGCLAAFKKVEKRWHFSKAFWLMLLSSLLWALADVLFKKYAADFGNFATAFAWFLLGSVLPAIFPILIHKMRRALAQNFLALRPREWFLLILNQCAGLGSSMAFAYALTLGKASLTVVLIGIQPLFAFLWGHALSRIIPEVSREELKKSSLLIKVVSLLLIFAGLVALQ